ncbi:MAG: transcription antitermination factor NusB [Ruminococcaceae bacterium]|nr:transcription antitermination factor NusB [Oscillospiraceae bacterium]
MKRSESREALFILMFQSTFYKDADFNEIIENATEEGEIQIDDYAKHAFEEIHGKLTEVDSSIEKYLNNRSISRLSRVALSALRIAVYEISDQDDVPESVAINEAVNLVKKYDTQESASYVNGVLGSYVRNK